MGLPVLLKKIFESDGYGPKLNRSVIPFAASLASASPNDVASAEWVKDLVDAEVYVDASVSSSGDGLTASTAVKTITEGIELLKQYPSGSGEKTRLNIAGGSYNEDVAIKNLACFINLSGNVTLNGNLDLRNFSGQVGDNQSTSLTISSGFINVSEHSFVIFNCNVSVTVTQNDHGLVVYDKSYCVFDGSLTINAPGAIGILFGGHSRLTINGICSITAGSGIKGYDYGFCNLTCSSLTINASNDNGIQVQSSYIAINATITTVSASGVVMYVHDAGIITMGSFTTSTLTSVGTNPIMTVTNCSDFYLYVNQGSTLNINKNGGVCYNVNRNSVLTIAGKGTVKYSGKSSTTAQVWGSGFLSFESSLAVSGSFSAGRRYSSDTLSVINVAGAGANRFPGTTAGTTTNGGIYL